MKKFIKSLGLLLGLVLFGFHATKGQNVQFSQYYNLIHYQNPAFVGTALAGRAMVHSRLQWPGLDSKYTTSVASVDYNLGKYNSGLGAMLVYDNQGSSAIRSYQGILQYAYQVVMTENSRLRAGVNVGMTSRTLNNSDLYYPDQFNGAGFNQNLNAPQYTKNYLDLGAGLLYYTPKFWLGVSAMHLNNPNQSFIGDRERLPIKFDFQTGYKFILKSNATMRYLEREDETVWALYPTVLYKWQEKSDQMDVGLYSIYDIFKVGVWYRGLPLKNYSSQLINNEAFIVLAGIKLGNFTVNYSYDFTLSKLNAYSQGAHELNLTLLFPKKRSKNYKYKTLPCPEFYGYKDE